MYGTVLYCTVLYYCTTLYYSIVLYSVLYCTVKNSGKGREFEFTPSFSFTTGY